MKKIILLISMVIVSTSCSQYQKVLKSPEAGEKYVLAEKLYNEAQKENSKSKYRKALRLFEQIVPQYRGKPQGEKLSFLFANTYYQLGDYYLSSYEFERFQQSYPNSDKVEEAAFRKTRSFYELSPRYDLDQTDTHKAIAELQAYLNTYPEGEHAEEANDMAAELRIKLEKKEYEIAKQYHLTGEARAGNYQAAITSFNNFLANNPGSPFREEAYYYRFDSAYQLAINSFRELMEERLEEALEYYQDYMKYYSEGEYSEAVEASAEDIKSRIQNF
ncbi:outer membrane protein assembly factor BamD [Salegentibacter sp. LM13S]|uniref:outer membrane protein assembly factor BamD n=1 Tax=Salegentibacter lacus TaxID=2873599 RepID=UPI001CCF45D1|nr:outer membrane protein assembly factor BamD [Salegentibacter lacus]MBZ9631583.1 outer membrane protein assembly factor BamD [Salegentibacter lacus]